jgi:ribonuclease BN (tRNA processing enzyme)
VVGAWGNEDLIENAFALEEYEPRACPRVGSLTFSFQSVPHFTETFAIRVESSNGGGNFAYGADSRPSQELIDFVTGADLLLVEATLPRPEREGIRGHLTPREAGEHAKAARVGRVVVTHLSDDLGRDWAETEASAGFGGPVAVAHEGAVYEI